MGKRKKVNPTTTEPHKNPDLSPHCYPTTTTPDCNHRPPPPLDPSPPSTATISNSDSEPDPTPPSSPRSVRRLLDPYSKPRLVSILAESAAANPSLRARLAAAADASPSHRRLFVHGLPPRASSSAALANAFSLFGPISDSHAVADRGYGFVTFASRAAARRALREIPRVSVAGCPVSLQFASAGPGVSSGGRGGAGRRVYVTNVAPDGGGAERLRAFFERFGELEGGPFGFDGETGRSRGYALFVYRDAAGAAKAVAEPYRVFEGRTLRCQLADEPKRKARAAATAAPPEVVVADSGARTPATPVMQPVLDAIAAAGVEELATCARDPAQAAASLAAAALSSALASVAASAASSQAAAPAPMPGLKELNMDVATARPATVAAVKAMPVAVAPSLAMPVKFGVRPSGSAGLLGPYKPPMASSSPGRR